MQRLLKTLATLVVLVILFQLPFARRLPNSIRMPLLFMTLTYGISLFLSMKLPILRRLGIAYLAFVGFLYFIAGVWGIVPAGGLIEANLWHGLISPYLLFSFFDQMSHHYPYPASKTAFYVLPEDHHHPIFSVTVIVVSVAAIVAAFAMTKSFRNAYRLWSVLLGLSVVFLAGYVIVAIVSPGQDGILIQLCWETSYVAAFLHARRGAELQYAGMS
jgi:hypothetical protein